MKSHSIALLAPLSLIGISAAYATGSHGNPAHTATPAASAGIQAGEANARGAANLGTHLGPDLGDGARPLRADVDGDGRLDLLLVHPSGAAALYRHGAGGLVALDAAFGPEGLPAVRSAAFGRANDDAQLDLLVVSQHGTVQLFEGDGRGAFADTTVASGLAPNAFVLAGRFDDLDGDGDEDLVLTTAGGFAIARNERGLFDMEHVTLAAPAPVEPAPVAPVAPAAPAATETSVDGDTTVAPTTRAPGGRALARTGTGHPRPSSPASSSVTPRPGTPGSVQPLLGPGSFKCAETLEDQGRPSACLSASTSPTLGALYPLTTYLNVAGSGKVGVNHTNPFGQLDVRTVDSTPALVGGTLEATAGAFSNTSKTIPALTASAKLGAGVAALLQGDVEIGYRLPLPFPFNVSRLFLDVGPNNQGRVRLQNQLGHNTLTLDATEYTNNGAEITLGKHDGTTTIYIDAENGAGGTYAAELSMRTSSGIETVEILSQEVAGQGGQIKLSKASGLDTMVFDADVTTGCELSLRNSAGTETIEMVTEEVSGNGAQIVLRKFDGSVGIILDAEQGGDSRITTEVLAITGGADLVEGFHTGGVTCEPGSVVVIDPNAEGQLTLSSTAYDARVAGVVSGAGGVRPGLTMGQAGLMDGDTKVALTGRVFVRCTAESGAIRAGDLLTTSSTAGAAMRASDSSRSFGAVIGKALGALESGEGLVLVLVSLQ